MGLVTDFLGAATATVISIILFMVFSRPIGTLITGVIALAFFVYAFDIRDKIGKNILMSVGGILVFATIYNGTIILLNFAIPSSAQFILGVISIGTWKIVIGLVSALILDGFIIAEIKDSLKRSGGLI